MKIDVSFRREHRLQGSRGSENHEISRLKSEEVKSASWVGTFVDFCEFWVPNGIPWGSIFEEKCSFFEVSNLKGAAPCRRPLTADLGCWLAAGC